MQEKYDWSNEVPDETIRKEFASANEVSFSARRFNYISYRSIAFGDFGWWFPLLRVLPLIGITPQMLRSVFSRVKEVNLPEVIETYEQLGGFPLSDKPFQELARILGKSVRVFRCDGRTDDHCFLFTAHPSGEIVEAAKAS